MNRVIAALTSVHDRIWFTLSDPGLPKGLLFPAALFPSPFMRNGVGGAEGAGFRCDQTGKAGLLVS